MAELLIVIFLMLFFSSGSQAQERQQIKGIVFDKESSMHLSGAHVLIEETSYGTITGPDGSFRLYIKDFPVTLKVSHIGFEDRYFTVTDDIKDETLMLGLQFSAELLEGVTISDKKAELIFKDEAYSVLDFEFHENGLMLLIYRNRLNRSELVLLSTMNDTLAMLQDLPGRAHSLFRDCRDFILYTTIDSAYQVHYTGGELQLIYPMDIATFRPVADAFKAFHDRYYYFSMNSFFDQVINYVRYDTASGKYFPFKTVSDERNMKILKDNPEDMSLLYSAMSDEMELDLLLEDADGASVFKKGNHNLARYISRQAHFLKACVYYPVYAPLFKSNDELILFNHPESMIEFLSPEGKIIRTTYISHHKMDNWKPLILKDDIYDKYYVVFEKLNRLSLRLIDLNTGMLGPVNEMFYPAIRKIQVRNGYAYFTYRQPGSIDRTMLFRQKLNNEQEGLLLTGQK
ncbi:MAG: carboxypeptidase-like regulatory domain-containing protein [Bacteroidales bacterium]|nr:carboxypeptidase-like regulatory domain-containing protein [Bacteroidales bacterium]